MNPPITVRCLLKSVQWLAYTSLTVLVICAWTPASATPAPIPPQTSIRVTIIQWIATKEEYQKWDAIGGEFQVSDDGTISMPLIGTITVGNFDADALASEIGVRLKERIGLVQAPVATVAILGYPPIYVVGEVKTPGEYKFRPGMTVLQSLAASGGEYREDNADSKDTTGLVGALRELENAILRSQIKIARLRAEESGTGQIDFAATPGQNAPLVAAIVEQEKAIMLARANLLERQSKSYAELRDLLTTEIDNLDQKTSGTDADIASVEKELRSVKGLVQKGIALPARQGDLERMLRSYYAGRLDLLTAIMRARQGISEASRNIEGLHDKQRSEVASELQVEEANLNQLMLKRETTQNQLLRELAQGADETVEHGPAALDFSLSRRVDGSVKQLPASEDTLLQPGDVVRVTRALPKTSIDEKTSSLAVGEPGGINQ